MHYFTISSILERNTILAISHCLLPGEAGSADFSTELHVAEPDQGVSAGWTDISSDFPKVRCFSS